MHCTLLMLKLKLKFVSNSILPPLLTHQQPNQTVHRSPSMVFSWSQTQHITRDTTPPSIEGSSLPPWRVGGLLALSSRVRWPDECQIPMQPITYCTSCCCIKVTTASALPWFPLGGLFQNDRKFMWKEGTLIKIIRTSYVSKCNEQILRGQNFVPLLTGRVCLVDYFILF